MARPKEEEGKEEGKEEGMRRRREEEEEEGKEEGKEEKEGKSFGTSCRCVWHRRVQIVSLQFAYKTIVLLVIGRFACLL